MSTQCFHELDILNFQGQRKGKEVTECVYALKFMLFKMEENNKRNRLESPVGNLPQNANLVVEYEQWFKNFTFLSTQEEQWEDPVCTVYVKV